MNDNKFFDEETVENVRQYEKTERALNEEKKKFDQIHKTEIMAEAAKNGLDPNELLEAYIGKNYNKITGKSFNWSAFFFGSLYVLYRKMYLYGFILMIFTNVISIFSLNVANIDMRISNPALVLGALLAVNLIIGLGVALTFNSMYLNYCMGKINDIREQYKNDKEKIIDSCKKKGGTNLLVAIILSLVLSGIASSIAMHISSIAK